jgi:putative Holliday junction resolvase
MTTKVLAFDFGTKKIGVAFGQSITCSASPLAPLPIRNQQIDWQAVACLVNEWQPDLLLVGLPLNMDGSESTMSKRCTRFAHQLEGRFRLPVKMIDERLSSRAARERLGNPGGPDARLDSIAATIMIEDWFNDSGASA